MANVVDILIKQSGQGTAISATAKELGGLDQAASNSIGVLGRFGSALGGMATIAGGILVANLFSKIVEGIGSFVSTGLDAVSSAQQLEVAFGALLTQNNLYAQSTETMSVAVGNLAEMQTEAAAKSDDLAFAQRKLTADINTQNASIQEQRQRIIQMADGLDKNQQVARLQEMEVALEGMNRELADSITEQGKLSKVTQDYTTVTKTSWEQVMSLTDAQRLAADQTKDLLSFVEKLAIVSPFEQEDVERVTKYAVGAGLGVDVTKKFTSAFLDWSAAVGITSVNLDEAAYQFLQIKKAGTITAIDLRQLSTRGLDLAKVIGVEMGMSIEEFNAKAKTTPGIFDELIDATIRYSNNTFAGTSEAMSTSIEGFKSTVSDLFTQSAKKVLRPLVDAITPTMSAMIGRAADFITGGGVEEIGQQLADTVMGGFAKAAEMGSKVMSAFEKFGIRGAGVSLLGSLGFSQEQVGVAMAVVDQIIGAVTRIQTAFDTFGARGAAFSIMGLLGLSSDTMVMINDAINTIITTLTNFGTQIAGVLGQISFDEILGGLTGIAVVLGAGVIMGLVTGLMALLTPVNLLIAGAALLGAAWAGNWGGIQEKTGAVVTYVTEQITALIAVLTPAFDSIWASITQVSEAFAGAGVTSGSLTTALQAIGEFLVGVAIPAFVQFVGILAGTLAQAIAGIADGMIAGHNAFVVISDYITGTVVPAFLSMNDGISLIVELVASLGEVINAVLNKALEAMAGLWQNVLWPALQKVGGILKDTLMPAFTSISETVSGDVSPVLKDLGEVIFPLLQEGLDFVTQSIKDLIGYFNSLKDTVSSFTLPDILTPGSPPPMANALTDIATSAGAATTALAGMQRNLITSSSSALSFIDDLDMGGLARQFGTGGGQWRNFRNILKNEIMGSMGALVDGTANVMDSIYKVAARFNFPPQMAAEFAKANGLVEHLTSSMAAFKQQMNIENLGNLTQMAASFSGLGSTFADMLTQQMAGGEAAKKTMEAYRKLTGEIGTQETQMATLQEELEALNAATERDTAAIEKKQKAIEKLTGEMEKNQKAIVVTRENYAALQAQAFDLFSGSQTEVQRVGSELATIALLEDFLRSGESSFLIPSDAVSQAAGITGILYDQISGQAELNRLVAEQAEREALITEQKEAQQKMDFLKSQLDLLKLGQSLGGDIFAGITFGLNASVEDMLAAVNAVTMAMVAQIDHDLGIASPSKLLFDKFKNQIGGAMVGGLLAVRPMMEGAIQPILNPIMQGANAAGKTVYNYFNQTVNTRADSSSVIGDFRTMQLMEG